MYLMNLQTKIMVAAFFYVVAPVWPVFLPHVVCIYSFFDRQFSEVSSLSTVLNYSVSTAVMH